LEDNIIENNNKSFISMGFALFIGIVYDRLFIGKSIGISFTIFVLLCMIFYFWYVKKEIRFQLTLGWFLLIPIMVLSFNFFIFTNPVLYAFNILIIPFLMVVSSILINKPNYRWYDISFVAIIFESSVIKAIGNGVKSFSIFGRIKGLNKSMNKGHRKQILLGLIISIPLLFWIILLLNSADMVFSFYINNIGAIFDNFNFRELLSHIFVISIISVYILGFVLSFDKKDSIYSKEEVSSKVSWEVVTLLTITILLNVVYCIFTIIQFSYLYGGGNKVLPAGFTYAEYARKGFFELVALTLINLIIVLSISKFADKRSKGQSVILNILLSFIVFFTLSMLYSASYKLSLYEASYGFTYLRLFVHVFMIFLLIANIMVFIGIWSTKLKVMKSLILTALVIYTVANIINIDGFIGKKNFELYEKQGKGDVYYLTNLSYEGLPYLLKLQNIVNENEKIVITERLNSMRYELEREKQWEEFNFSKNRARELLSKK